MVPTLSFSERVKKFFSLNPVLVRGVLVSFGAVVLIIARYFGLSAINDDSVEDTVNAIVNAFVAVSALITALWARGRVIAEDKVIVWTPDPDGDVIAAGPVSVNTAGELAAVQDAAIGSASQAEVKAVLDTSGE